MKSTKRTSNQLELPFWDPFTFLIHAWGAVACNKDLSVQDRWDAAIILDLAYVRLEKAKGRLKSFPPLRRTRKKSKGISTKPRKQKSPDI